MAIQCTLAHPKSIGPEGVLISKMLGLVKCTFIIGDAL